MTKIVTICHFNCLTTDWFLIVVIRLSEFHYWLTALIFLIILLSDNISIITKRWLVDLKRRHNFHNVPYCTKRRGMLIKKYHIVLDNTYLITCYIVTDKFSPQSYQYNWLLNIFLGGWGVKTFTKKKIYRGLRKDAQIILKQKEPCTKIDSLKRY